MSPPDNGGVTDSQHKGVKGLVKGHPVSCSFIQSQAIYSATSGTNPA